MTRFFDEEEFKCLKDNKKKNPVDFIIEMRDEFLELCEKYKLSMKMSFSFSESAINIYINSIKIFKILNPYDDDPITQYCRKDHEDSSYNENDILNYIRSKSFMEFLQTLLEENSNYE